MRKLTLVLAVIVVVLASTLTGSAVAGRPNVRTCGNETLTSGDFDGLIVTGHCQIEGPVTINGRVTVVGEDAFLDASYLSTQLTINGNVKVGKGAILGLGCTYYYHPASCGFPAHPVDAWLGDVTVNGNINANQARTMYLDFAVIHGNVVSNGGGGAGDSSPGIEDGDALPIKDNVIDGDVIVHGWQGAWLGVIRNTVGGNVIVSHTAGNRYVNEPPFVGLDSTEVATNTIHGNLICQGNSPAAQIGDSGGTTNTVDGNKIGECANV